MLRAKRILQRGFSLLEAALVLLIVGIMASAVSSFIVGPVTGYLKAAQRTTTADDGAFILQTLSRALRTAIPNTVRVKSSPYPAIEFVPALSAVTYRTTGGNNLVFDQAISLFDAVGDYSSELAAAQSAGDSFRLVVFQQNAYTGGNTDMPIAGLNLYNATPSAGPYPAAGTHVVTPTTTSVAISSASMAKTNISNTVPTITGISMSAPFQFAFDSPQQKMFIFDTTAAPITFLCNTDFGTLTEYWGYPISATQPPISSSYSTSLPLSSASNALVSNDIVSCSFSYEAGVSYRAAVVTINLGVKTQSGETILLVQEIQVPSTP